MRKVNKKEARWEQAAGQASRAAAIRPETGRTEGSSHTVRCPAARCLHPIFSAWPVTEGLFPCQKQTTQQRTTCHRAYLSFLLLESQLLSLSLFLFRLCGLRLRSRLRHEHSPSRWLPPDCLESTEADRLSSLLRQKEWSSASFNHWSPQQTSLEPNIL